MLDENERRVKRLEAQRRWRERNRDYVHALNRDWVARNKDYLNAKRRQRRAQAGPGARKDESRRYYERHHAEIRKQQAEYRARNSDKIKRQKKQSYEKIGREYQRTYLRQKRKTNIQFRMAEKIRANLADRLARRHRKQRNPNKKLPGLNCTLTVLVKHIEDQFRLDMTWENWAVVWQLDHIIPLSAFDLTKPTQFRRAAHYTNVQPLLLIEHRAKSKAEKHS